MQVHGFRSEPEINMAGCSSIHMLIAFAAVFFSVANHCGAVELTFELPDSAKECFYEVIEQGKESTLEFQVGLNFPCSFVLLTFN